ncbi:conjugal transfer protein TraI [Amycolatopsis sp. NPDC051758]|uniref:conjugal transfer protein TraI n=1 Tax=Amycolatopsis sp. NPDC051758 TaxID=3363935 RepID=UPI00378C527F
MSTATTTTDDGHPDLARTLTEIERQLAANDLPAPPEPAEPEPTPEPPGEDEPAPDPRGTRRTGITRRVRRRAAEHAEAHQLLALEADTAPYAVTTEKVRSRRKAVEQAAALWQLDRDPRVLAYRDARVRRGVLAVALVSLTLALAWSTAGVQAFAAEGAPAGSPRWWFAWLAEPFCSLALLMVVAGRAYLTTRGQPLHDKAVDRTEWVFLGLTLGMNAWPHLPGVATDFTVSGLVLHLLGPVVAVAVVRCLPRLLAAFAGLALPVDDPDAVAAPTNEGEGLDGAATLDPTHPPLAQPIAEQGDTRTDQPGQAPPARAVAARRKPSARRSTRLPEPKRRTLDQLREEFKTALAARPAGFDPDNGESIRRTLRCGKKFSVQLRDEHRDGRIG